MTRQDVVRPGHGECPECRGSGETSFPEGRCCWCGGSGDVWIAPVTEREILEGNEDAAARALRDPRQRPPVARAPRRRPGERAAE